MQNNPPSLLRGMVCLRDTPVILMSPVMNRSLIGVVFFLVGLARYALGLDHVLVPRPGPS